MKAEKRYQDTTFSWGVSIEFDDGLWFQTSVPTEADADEALADPEGFYRKLYEAPAAEGPVVPSDHDCEQAIFELSDGWHCLICRRAVELNPDTALIVCSNGSTFIVKPLEDELRKLGSPKLLVAATIALDNEHERP